MKRRSVFSRIVIVVGATLMLTLSATLAWAAVIDYEARGLVPNGVTVVGHDLSGMTESQARSAIENAVSTPMLRPVTVAGDSKTWTLDPKGIVSVDVDSMLNEAYTPRRSATFVARLASQVIGEPLPADIKPAYSINSTAIAAWVAQIATRVDRKPVDAKRKVVKYNFKITPCKYGASVDQTASVTRISQALTADAALSSGSRVVSLSVTFPKPKVVQSMFKTAIIVSLPDCQIRLFHGAKLVKTYSCAPGRPSYPTPTGDFKVDSKQANAPWINPHSAWSASMPEVISGGPSNPMGDRKIGINYSGVFMHGVPPGEYGTIGSHASHGCMRMLPSDVHDLYPRVEVGDPVFIRN
jgi:L,D-transpeptidase catalytic domain/Putative peptidoglycan binding domain